MFFIMPPVGDSAAVLDDLISLGYLVYELGSVEHCPSLMLYEIQCRRLHVRALQNLRRVTAGYSSDEFNLVYHALHPMLSAKHDMGADAAWR
jgi:hypothetical protein